MNEATPTTPELRLVFMGMNGVFSQVAFRHMVQRGHRPVAAFVASAEQPHAKEVAPGDLPIITPEVAPTLASLARRHGVAVYETARLDETALNLLRALAPDLVIVACFPYVFKKEWLTVPKRGYLNIHPSLLPAYRGPYPVFWQLRDNTSPLGVTLHLIDEGLDTGPILAQTSIHTPPEWHAAELDSALAAEGAAFVTALLAQSDWVGEPQTATGGASYQPAPTIAARTLSRSWTAAHAFRFVRGASDWAPFFLKDGDAEYGIARAISYAPDTAMAAGTLLREGQFLTVPFSDGVVTFLLEFSVSYRQ